MACRIGAERTTEVESSGTEAACLIVDLLGVRSELK